MRAERHFPPCRIRLFFLATLAFSSVHSSSCAHGGPFCTSGQQEEVGESDRGEEGLQSTPMTILEKTASVFARVVRSEFAWRSGASSNAGLVANLKRNGLFADARVEEAMLSVDRGDFAPHTPYGDHPVSIGYGATISAPHMHAASLELLKNHLQEGDRVLDVGSGSGYLTACMAIMVGETGKVVGIEHIGELVELGDANVRKHHEDLITSGRLLFVEGDGRLGYPSEAPYKAIHVGAAAPKLPPKLVEQLAKGGRMVIPVGTSSQRFLQVDKDGAGEVHITDLMGVIYVPLTDRQRQVPNSA